MNKYKYILTHTPACMYIYILRTYATIYVSTRQAARNWPQRWEDKKKNDFLAFKWNEKRREKSAQSVRQRRIIHHILSKCFNNKAGNNNNWQANIYRQCQKISPKASQWGFCRRLAETHCCSCLSFCCCMWDEYLCALMFVWRKGGPLSGNSEHKRCEHTASWHRELHTSI